MANVSGGGDGVSVRLNRVTFADVSFQLIQKAKSEGTLEAADDIGVLGLSVSLQTARGREFLSAARRRALVPEGLVGFIHVLVTGGENVERFAAVRARISKVVVESFEMSFEVSIKSGV